MTKLEKLIHAGKLSATVLSEHVQYDEEEPSRESEAMDACNEALKEK